MELTTVIGISASLLTAVSMLPQLIHILREKKAETMSYWVPAILILGVGGWVWYGFLKEDRIIILSNGFSLLLNCTILVLSLKYGKNKIGY